MGEQAVSFSDSQFFSFSAQIGVVKIWHRHGTPDIPPARPGDTCDCMLRRPPCGPHAATVMFVHMGKLFVVPYVVFRRGNGRSG